jgi:aminopeptidase N
MSRSTPLTQYIFIGPKGQNVDVIAHELMHAEMGVRVGYLADRHSLPIWFKEGFALQVDRRGPFVEQLNVSQQQIDGVRQFYTRSQFRKEPSTVIHNYQLSQLAVAQLNLDNLEEKLLAIKQGESFESVFLAD